MPAFHPGFHTATPDSGTDATITYLNPYWHSIVVGVVLCLVLLRLWWRYSGHWITIPLDERMDGRDKKPRP